ncbi:hypothetical protein P5673_001405 [Acropora cervicornis]|uniref:Uncharacterized protein n=1 Tax=Acropora cervicornis TaxID=6130 RepID=A0AAD9Q774_ACRCE|nr:hypothetical protein P5673_022261 [Acropora cervicornis]KAK2573718.1 hypothetical protein P5673_001405 [Acropora cervicornis]
MYDTFGCPFSFESPENKAMAKKVLDAVHQLWKSLRDDFTRKSSKKYEEHSRNVKRNNHLKRVSFCIYC